MIEIRRLSSLVTAYVLLAATVTYASMPTYTFTGAVGTDFYNVLNWDDGLGGNPASIIDGGSGKIELCLEIDGSTAVAGSAVEFGAGMLALKNSATFDISTGNLTFGTSSSFSVADSTLNLLSNAAQLAMNSGSTTDFNKALINVGDDLFFRSQTSIVDSRIVSRADDIEFQSTSVINALSGTELETLDLAQIVSFVSSATMTDVSIITGRVSMQTGVNIVAIDSDWNLNGDLDDSFNSRTDATLTLKGTSVFKCDQLDEGIAIYLEDSSSASLIDDDAEGEWITAASVGDMLPSKIVFRSPAASLTFGGPQGANDDRTQIFNGLTGTEFSYASFPGLFTPSNWNGVDDVTIQAVPEPAAMALALACMAGLAWIRR